MNDLTEPEPTHNPRYHHFQLTGKDPRAFAAARDKLLTWFNQLLDNQLDAVAGTTVRDEAHEFIHESLTFLKAKLKKADFENEKIQAETVDAFASAKERLANARKTSAEAQALELDNMIKQMKIQLTITKVIVMQDTSDAAILFGRDVEALLIAIREIEGSGIKALPEAG